MSDTPEPDDDPLGMRRPITRRNFIDGVAVGLGSLVVGGAVGSSVATGAPRRPVPAVAGDTSMPPGEYYPPAWTGNRGYYVGAETIPHAVANGEFWATAPAPTPTGERYDLVVVGAGISGLAAARFFQQQFGDDVSILLLEALDDVGGHARRNEFTTSSRALVGYGGSQSLEAPSSFAPPARDLLVDVGIEVAKFEQFFDSEFDQRHGLGRGIFFDAEHWGEDRLVTYLPDTPWEEVLLDAPMAEEAKAQIADLYAGATDYLPGLSDTEKKDVLAEITYLEYLQTHVQAHPDTIKYFQTTPNDNWAYGADAVGALDASVEFVGFDGLGLDWEGDPDPRLAPTSHKLWVAEDDYIYHFPEGNHGVVKALVRKLIPAALPGTGMETITSTRLVYEELDDPASRVRVRLNSPVVRVAHVGDLTTATEVEVSYARDGAVETVTAGRVVLACNNNLIPHLTDELGIEQEAALTVMRRLALSYATVEVRNWTAWRQLGVSEIRFPTGYWDQAGLDFPVSIGSYEFPDDPAEPILLHLSRAECEPGAGHPLLQAAIGRQRMLDGGFEPMERALRTQLQAALGAGGFDAAEDITAITINRWAHGYAYEYGRPWEVFWPDGPIPSHVGRARFGRVAIANTDSAPRAYVDSAIDMAYRAVMELAGKEATEDASEVAQGVDGADPAGVGG